MITCEKCGADNPATARFCGSCGAGLLQGQTENPWKSYFLNRAESYKRDAQNHQKQVESYYRKAEYYRKKAESYQRELDNCTREDKASTYAIEAYKATVEYYAQMQCALAEDEKVKKYLGLAADAMRNAQ